MPGWAVFYFRFNMIPEQARNAMTQYGFDDAEWLAMPWKERRLQLARYECDFLKVQEHPRGSNKGKDVEKYLASVGLGGGYAWCAAFVNWLTVGAGAKEFRPEGNRAMAASWLKASPKKAEDVERGDLFGYINSDGTGHVGLVVKVYRDAKGKLTKFDTIEGNTNDEGSREGFEVCRRTRAVDSKTKFAR